jgi:starch synthase
MRALFATAELTPLVRVGGLAYAAAGMARALHDAGVDITVVLPDYGFLDIDLSRPQPLDMPAWVGITTFRRGTLDGGVPLVAVRTPAIDRPHPYTDPDGRGWSDNDFRFMAFSAAIARLAEVFDADVVHLNDWHTAAALGFVSEPRPSVITIHNLAYQGTTHAGWLDVMTNRREAFEWHGTTNPLSGAIALADRVVTVSPNYSEEIRRPEHGAGLDGPLRVRGDAVVGILNGIDTTAWNPASDPHLPVPFDADDLTGKGAARRALTRDVSLTTERSPIIGVVTRLTWQKGIDIALELTPYLDRLPARLVLLGSGERDLADRARWVTAQRPGRLAFVDGFDEPLAHRIFGGADLLLMPSRFEPCGLAQMQAMTYGTIPIVTDVGGLHDTVRDADSHHDGTGFVAGAPDAVAVLDALHRAVRAWRAAKRRRAIQERGMRRDWSWRDPAARQIDVYDEVLST